MLWKPYRLRKSQQFQEIISAGQKVSNRNFSIFLTRNKLDNCQFGISTPQKIVKKAVERNYYKRQIRHMLISHLQKYNESCRIDDSHLHYNLIIILRSSYLENDFTTNQESLYKLLFFAYRKFNNNIWREEKVAH
jgi:ribonuclease P protein component